jgi:hypothetical protein
VELGSDKSSMVRTIDDLERLGLCRTNPTPIPIRARAATGSSTEHPAGTRRRSQVLVSAYSPGE